MKATANQIMQAMGVRNNAAALLETGEPVDAWEVSQEMGLTEKQVEWCFKYLESNNLVRMEAGKVVEILELIPDPKA